MMDCSLATELTRSARLRAWLRALGCLAVVLGLATSVAAQERYEMSEQGWRQQPSYPTDSPEGRLQAMRKLLAQGKAKTAEKLATKWIKELPDHPLAVEAYLIQGDARAARHHYYEALYAYEYIARQYPSSEQFTEALEREFEIARLYVNGMNRRLLGMRILPATGEGEELLIRIQERAPGSEIGERAHLLLADYYFESAQMTNAADAYDLFLENYPQSSRRELAMLRVIQANLARYKGPQYDQRGLLEAQQRLKLYAEEYPAAAERIGAKALLVRIHESLARRDLLTARWYERRQFGLSAAVLYRRVVTDYPGTAAASEAIDALRVMGEPVVVAPVKDTPRGREGDEQ